MAFISPKQHTSEPTTQQSMTMLWPSSKRANKFGAANADERDLGVGFDKKSGVTTDDGGKAVGLKALEGYFDNLATAKTNKKIVLDQLVSSNANLAATNKELVDVVKN